jgi:transposase
LCEALVLSFAAVMPVAKVAAMTREHDSRIWRVVEHPVHTARDQLDLSGVARVGMEETSARKGQDSLSIFADLDARRVVFATKGRNAKTVARFATDLTEHGGAPEKITDTSPDMSTAFTSGIRAHLPNATMTFDRFHRAATLSEALDVMRRHEVTTRPELQHTRWLWLKNWRNLTTTQRRELARLMRPSTQLTTARALRWRQDSQAFYHQTPATPKSTCDAGAQVRNAPASNPSKTSSPWSRNTETASSPGTKTTPPTACPKASTPSSRPPRPGPGAPAAKPQ